jgi:hypothetical protein
MWRAFFTFAFFFAAFFSLPFENYAKKNSSTFPSANRNRITRSSQRRRTHLTHMRPACSALCWHSVGNLTLIIGGKKRNCNEVEVQEKIAKI